MANQNSYQKRPLWHWILIYLLIGGLVYAAVYYFYFAKQGGYDTSYTSPGTTTQSSITITDTGYEPTKITISAGQTVTWTNSSSTVSNVSSAPHPEHTDYPPLNLGDLQPGASVSLTFPTAGTYYYHNHLDSSQFGQIIVQ